mmetsp:Transcript_2346/g.5353  ORF Transcript_2346/g.5353 Transcript_2346/m.5353 type:complete len:222 (-) Transcript_2346:332-997(-)
MRSSVRSSLSWSGSTGVLRLGLVDISIWDRIIRIVLRSPQSTPKTVPTPTVAPVCLPKPPSCAPEPPVTAVNNLVSSAGTRMDSKSAPSTIRRMERFDWMPLLVTRAIRTRLVFMLMRMRPMIMIVISRFMLHVQEISYILRMMVSGGTILMETLSHLTSKPTPSPGGTCPADAPSACSTETSLNTTHPPSLPSDSSSEPMNSSVRRLASSTLASMPIPVK